MSMCAAAMVNASSASDPENGPHVDSGRIGSTRRRYHGDLGPRRVQGKGCCMSKNVFNGPLLFIILGGLALLAYRYLPFESLLEKIKAGRGDAQITEQAAPPAAPASASALPDTAAESAAVTTMPPAPTVSPQPSAVAMPEVRSPPPPVVVPAEVSYIAINCGDGRVHKSPKKRLEPHRLDTFEFQQQFSRRTQEFIASQGYFLKP